MKRVIFRISISLLAFAVGFSIFWLAGLIPAAWTKPVVSKLRTIAYELPIVGKSTPKPRFRATYRACGWGYAQSYETDDGQELSEGVTEIAAPEKVRAKIENLIADSVRVVERVPGYKNYRGESGERVVLVNPPDQWNAKETASILWRNDDDAESIAFISAPSLELALEFEKFLESTNYGY